MIEVTFTMSANTEGHDPVLTIASWIGLALQEEPMDGMTIHELRIEEQDA